MIACAYCGNEWRYSAKACASCGAPEKLSKLAKYDPFFYDGYIVYCIRDYPRALLSWIFYKGITLIGRVDITEQELDKFSPSIDMLPIVLERLQAQT